MVADMLRFASVAAVDTMVLVSGDADYAPAVEGVHALGKQAYVATWGGTGLSHRLRKISFDHIDMLDGLHLFEAEKHSDNQDDRGREGDESAAQRRAAQLTYEKRREE